MAQLLLLLLRAKLLLTLMVMLLLLMQLRHFVGVCALLQEFEGELRHVLSRFLGQRRSHLQPIPTNRRLRVRSERRAGRAEGSAGQR